MNTSTDEPVYDGPLPMPISDADCDGLMRCKCGKAIRFAGSLRCDDCFTDTATRFHGNDQLIKTTIER